MSLPEFEQPLTVQLALRSIGQWVRVLPGFDLAIIIKVTGTGVLVRYAGDTGRRGSKHHYSTCSLKGLVLRKDRAGRIDPNWLQAAIAKQGRGTPELFEVVRLRTDQAFTPAAVDPEFVYAAYAKARKGGASAAELSDIFEGSHELEADYLEAVALDLEFDAKVKEATK